MKVRLFALITGIVYLLVGIAGLFPDFVAAPPTMPDTLAADGGYGYLFGVFPINMLHNVVHLAVGVGGISAYRTYLNSSFYSKVLASVYGLLTVMGLFPVTGTTFGLVPIFGNDVWLHALTAAAAGYFGFFIGPDIIPPQGQKGTAAVGQE